MHFSLADRICESVTLASIFHHLESGLPMGKHLDPLSNVNVRLLGTESLQNHFQAFTFHLLGEGEQLKVLFWPEPEIFHMSLRG